MNGLTAVGQGKFSSQLTKTKDSFEVGRNESFRKITLSTAKQMRWIFHNSSIESQNDWNESPNHGKTTPLGF